MNVGFLFSGQGSQYKGMGRDICNEFKEANNIYELASSELKIDLKKMMWEEDESKITITQNAQPCIFTMSMAILEVLKKFNISPKCVAGLSLGEYSAHVASESLKFQDTVKLVRIRGKLMQEEIKEGIGGMVALFAEKDKAEKICESAKEFGIVEVANLNCPSQTVISGEVKALKEALEIAKKKNIKAKFLSVSAPFHSSLLKGAGKKLRQELENIEVYDMKIPIISNVTANYIKSKDEIKSLFERQVYSCVKFEESIKLMIKDGIDTLVEIGPLKILASFAKKIDKNVKTLCTNNLEDLKSTIKELEGVSDV